MCVEVGRAVVSVETPVEQIMVWSSCITGVAALAVTVLGAIGLASEDLTKAQLIVSVIYIVSASAFGWLVTVGLIAAKILFSHSYLREERSLDI